MIGNFEPYAERNHLIFYIPVSQLNQKSCVLLGFWVIKFFSLPVILYRESEYAAWTLVNGYAVNHVTVSVHRLKSRIKSIKTLNQFIEEHGYKLNSEGGTLKGLLPTLNL